MILSATLCCSLPIIFASLYMLAITPTSYAAPSIFPPQNHATPSSSDHEFSIARDSPRILTRAPLDIETRPYYRKWMIDFYPLEVTAENKKFYFQNGTFDNYLGRNLVDDWDNSANRGGYNAGVYTFTGPKRTYLGGHPPNQLVVKVLRQDQLDKWAYGEVMALELAGLYVASGKKSKNQIFAVFMKNRKSRPAIIMKKVQGMSLLKTTVWRRADPAMKISLKNAVKEIIKVQVVDFAVQHGILHNDFHTGNVFVDLSQDGTVRGAKLIDYGYPGMISIRSTNRKVLEKYFEWRWAKLWDGT
ncbi:hypothetical protein C8R41DRAFT_850371 [Lentinula lateritia]|uniref:Protein kinase domain-containing protein n=1 Tax=Lentinula lateritia TaxID=40482 RepID=A0ABQ8V361_9AGAR|nr:hypothetical protein C8R41DRAFT_850371 [Lentinula lateritia]